MVVMSKQKPSCREFSFQFFARILDKTPGAINPAGALIAYLAQRVLKDPISKAFSFEYAVTGNWADPQVTRVQTLPVGQAQDTTKPVPAPAAPLAPASTPATPATPPATVPPATPAATANR